MTAVGGYKKREDHSNDEGIQNAAKFAAKEIGKAQSKDLTLAQIKSAHSQVVAGMNYKLVLELDTGKKKIESYEATVYEPLGGQPMKLTEHKAL